MTHDRKETTDAPTDARVLAGVSDSPSGRAALAVAVREAQALNASLHLVRVWREAGWLWSMTAADVAGLARDECADAQLLARAASTARAAAPDLHVVTDFVPGDLYSLLLSLCHGAELLVVGSADEASSDRLISEWFVQRSSCPVVVVDAREQIVHGQLPSRVATAS